MSFPWRRDRPGQPPATQHDIRHRGTARHRRIPLQREQGACSLRRAGWREDAGDLCAEEPAGSVRPRAAGGHCLNGLPVHRSVLVAGHRGQAASGEPAVRSGHKAKSPAVMLA